MSLFINGFKDSKNVKEFKELGPDVQNLLNAAIKARENAYCPYSNFPVGAAILTENNEVFTGCNIENGAYTAGLCAERTAAAKAISEGQTTFKAIAVVAQQESFTTPCGVCRQFISEFASKDIPIYAAKPTNPPLRVLCTSIYQLLPESFSLSK
ncbi:CDA.2 family protein [Megaselia abdita]